jgi:hypothetical protein
VIVVWLAICYVVVVLFLISICVAMYAVLRERRLRRLVGSEQFLLEDRGEVGLTEQELRRLRNLFSIENLRDVDAVCSICFENAEGNVLKVPECEHMFHEDCLSGWLRVKPICPNCKAGIRRHLD